MTQQKILLEDESSDKKYFTIIPNYIANHSTANEQALYFQLKRLAGDTGKKCYPSYKYLMEQMKIGIKALKKSFQYLIDNNWIEDLGKKQIMTTGGLQWIKGYKINDIWKLNIEYYEGYAESTPLQKGVSKDIKGVSKERKGVLVVGDKEELIRTNNNISPKGDTKIVPSYGNEDINKLISFLKEKLGGSLDGSQISNRRFAKLLLDKIKRDYPDKNAIEGIYKVIELGLQDKFHGQNLTNFKYLYYNFQKIIQSIKVKITNPNIIKIK